MLVLPTPAAFAAHVGQTLGPTAWRSLSQGDIDAFARLSGDDHWIHVDTQRARQESAGGKTIVHGLHILSLIPAWQRALFRIEQRGAGLHYGYDRVRFVAPVPVESSIRLLQTVVSSQQHSRGTRIALTSMVEVDEPVRTAIVAEGILLIADG